MTEQVPELLKVGEAAKYVGYSRSQFDKLCEEGGPSAVYINGRRRFRKKDLDEWIASLPTEPGQS
jgi:excisionase family DNA binding protein